MTTQQLVVILVAAAMGTVVAVVARRFKRMRATRVITCPETSAGAAVHIGAASALGAALRGSEVTTTLRLSDCTRWPERAGCGQECLSQIEQAPADCMLVGIVRAWYEGKQCVLCSRPVSAAHWYDHRPALIGDDRVARPWSEVPPERIPEVLASHRPLCWDCYLVESLYREHRDVIVERPAEPLRKSLYH